ncbi:DNA modification system-associated small protein [Bosea sp. (in: a-proteobacteria)]|uniref:DNA modification system-associated small protein n=1 Tax=Bosea sp. (in: a-proteobacteria) TaxID=1871050 RepID=UPI002735772B|nr:DNA modification system-associated small protein [Bosea sp. (in: a-proteobacteria)]MDP3410803.1 hypothetical protein [Bosea sp. (in: a-proteobacteria)]
MSDNEDLALETLLAIRKEVAPDLSEALLRQCYAIQKRHQFSDDRVQASTAMERLIDQELDKMPKADNHQ